MAIPAVQGTTANRWLRPVSMFSVIALLLATLGAVVATTPAQADTPTVFTADGTYTVPTGVTKIKIVAIGGGGGSGVTAPTNPGGAGGGGSIVTAIQQVTPGDNLSITIGQGGGAGQGNTAAIGGAGGSAGGDTQASTRTGGAGGGSTTVMKGSDVQIVAGGGGGGGGAASSAGQPGGAGGSVSSEGTAYSAGAKGGGTAPRAGLGGSSSSAGTGGGIGTGSGNQATVGNDYGSSPDPGKGGLGGHQTSSTSTTSGGGGGGGYGGGGGGGASDTSNGSGGGGGGSWVGKTPNDGTTYLVYSSAYAAVTSGTVGKGGNSPPQNNSTNLDGNPGTAGNVTIAPAYNVTYDANGGSGSPPVDPNYYMAGDSVTLLGNTGPMTNSGYVFSGWCTTATAGCTDGTPYGVGSSMTMPSSDVILYAEWELPPTYTVTYNGNGADGGSVPVDSNTYSAGDQVTALGNTGSLTKNGYTFNDWCTTATTGCTDGTVYAVGDHFSMPAQNTTLYAQWTATIYTVDYTAGAHGYIDTPADCGDLTYTIESATITPNDSCVTAGTGYTFNGWIPTTVPTGSTDNQTLTAQWTVNTYTVSYDGNGGSGTPPVQQSGDYNSSITLAAGTGLTWTGHTFDGWNTQSDGQGTHYAASSSYTIGASNVTLYAEWTLAQYTISYVSADSSQGTVSGACGPTSYDITSGTVAPTDATCLTPATGYHFDHWTPASFDAATTTGNQTFTASWALDTYTISYTSADSSQGTVSGACGPTSYDITSGTVAPTDATCLTPAAGYHFDQWTPASFDAATTTGNQTFTASWALDTYTISYTSADSSQGTVSGACGPISYDITSGTVAPTDSTCLTPATGYHFDHWTPASFDASTTTGNQTFTASWALDTYTISYTSADSSQGTVSGACGPTSYDITSGTVAPTDSTCLTPETGYHFDQWTPASFDASTTTGNQTFVASWAADTYTVSYTSADSSQGTVSGACGPTSYDITSGTVAPTDSTCLTPATGYHFDHWTPASFDAATTTGNQTFVASWAADTYTISYTSADSSEGTVSGACGPTSYDITSGTVAPTDATCLTPATGYHFDQWTPASFDASTTTGNQTFTASWALDTYTISYTSADSSQGTVSGACGPISYDITSGTVAPTDSTCLTPATGYHFDQWTPASFDASTTTGNQTFVASWAADTYTVSYTSADSSQGTVSGACGPISYDITSGTVAPTDATCLTPATGYHFDQWTPASFDAATTTGNQTFVASWAATSYNLSYDANAGTGNAPTQQTVTFDSPVTLATNSGTPALAKTGYSFNGWCTTVNITGCTTGTHYAAGAMINNWSIASDTTLYAQWSINQYTVTYDINNGSGTTPTPQSGDYNSSITLAAGTGLTRTGFTFDGWNAQSDGTGTHYAASSSYTIDAGNVTLFAEWSELPIVAAPSVDQITGTSLRIKSNVDAGASDVTSTECGIGLTNDTGTMSWSAAAPSSITTGSSAEVKCTVTNLTPATQYYTAMRATNTAGTATSDTTSTSTVNTPAISAPSASVVTGSSATISALLAPRGAETTAITCDYGTSADAMTQTAAASPATVAGSTASTTVSCDVSGLARSTRYAFTVSATNAAGSTTSEVGFLTTQDAAPIPPQLIDKCPDGSCAGADLAGMDLAGLDLSGIDFAGVDFTGAYLVGVNFSDCNLSGVRFGRANMVNVDMTNANLTGATFTTGSPRGDVRPTAKPWKTSANMTRINLTKANLTRADLRGVNLTKANFTKVRATSARFTYAVAKSAKFTNGNFASTDFRWSYLAKASFKNSNIRKADFRHATLTHTSFTNTKGKKTAKF